MPHWSKFDSVCIATHKRTKIQRVKKLKAREREKWRDKAKEKKENKDGDSRNWLDGTLNWKYTWQTPPYVITLSIQNIQRKAFEHISTLKRKISAFTRWMAKCFNHATGAQWADALSLTLSPYRSAFPVYNYFCICAVELELCSLYLVKIWHSGGYVSGMHVSYSCLHAPIKIVIQVNFESKNINKCHPFSHILCLSGSKYKLDALAYTLLYECIWNIHGYVCACACKYTIHYTLQKSLNCV